MIYHKRTEWQLPNQPVTGPAMDRNAIVRIVIHYPGGNVSKPYNTITRLRAEQNTYLHKVPAYSLGYNWMIDDIGDVWEVRGFEIKCAANEEVNATSVAIQFIVDDQDAANEAQIRAARELVAQIRTWRSVDLPLVTHSSVATHSSNTPCPGAGLTPQVLNGTFEPLSTPPVTPGKIGRAMIIDYAVNTASYTRFVTDFTNISWVFDGQWAGVIGKAGLPVVEVGWEDLLSAIRSLKPTTGPPPTIDGQLLEAWNAPRPD